MKVHLGPETVEERKRPYAALCFSSKVTVECNLEGLRTSFVPFIFGDLTAVAEITAEDELTEGLLRLEVLRNLFLEPDHSLEVREISKKFKFVGKHFRALVVKYIGEGGGGSPQDVLQTELSRLAFGQVRCGDFELYLFPGNVTVSRIAGCSISGQTSSVEEAVRQALLIAKWFREGRYEELPSLALRTENDGLKAMVERWSNLLKVVVFGDVLQKVSGGRFDFSLARLIRDLNEFRRTTCFDPFRDVEKVALGILLTRCGGGLSLEPDDHFIVRGVD